MVVTGYGMITPLGPNTIETFENCASGKSGIDRIRSFDVTGLPCQVAGEVNDACLSNYDHLFDRRCRRYSSRGLKMMAFAALGSSFPG